MTRIEERARTAGQELRDWRPPEGIDGSPAATAARAVRRSRARRAALGLGALALAAGVVSAQWPDGGDRVEIGPPADQEEPARPPRRESTTSTTTTTAPDRTTGTSVPDDPGAGEGQGPGTTAGAPEPSEAGPPPEPSVRDVDFGAATYPAPCPTYDGGAVTLAGGRATVPVGGARLDVYLGPVSYADADGDGDEDAIVVVRCDFVGANVDSGALLTAYRAGAGGQPEALGPPQALRHVHDLSARGLTVTATVDVYGPDDPNCCPSSGAEQTWAFTGGGFALQTSRDIPPPGSG